MTTWAVVSTGMLVRSSTGTASRPTQASGWSRGGSWNHSTKPQTTITAPRVATATS